MAPTAHRMTSAEIYSFLEAPRHAIAAVVRPDGAPQLSPIWFLFERERFYLSTLAASAKCRHLGRDPRISLCIDAGYPDARAVVASGIATRISEHDPNAAEMHWRIARRYHESDEAARRWFAETEHEGPAALFSIAPERLVGWDYN